MLPPSLRESIRKDIDRVMSSGGDFGLPEYSPDGHVRDLSESGYFKALMILRHYMKVSSDQYFSNVVGARNVDLFMLIPSVSSPMGPGSDSEPLPIKFGDNFSNLVDSSQFGF